MGGRRNVNLSVFWEIYIGFLKGVVSQNIAKIISIWTSKVAQNSMAIKKQRPF